MKQPTFEKKKIKDALLGQPSVSLAPLQIISQPPSNWRVLSVYLTVILGRNGTKFDHPLQRILQTISA